MRFRQGAIALAAVSVVWCAAAPSGARSSARITFIPGSTTNLEQLIGDLDKQRGAQPAKAHMEREEAS